MSRRPINNNALKWLAVIGVLLLNAAYIISTTMRFQTAAPSDNYTIELGDADSSIDMITNTAATNEVSIEGPEIKESLKVEDAAEPNGEVGKIDILSASVSSPPLDKDQTVSNSTDFTRYDDVVIVTKTLWSKDLQKLLKPNLCYLSHAYNDKRRYDIVVFTTLPWTEDEIAELQAVVAPAKLTVALEGPPLEEQVAVMTKEEKDFHYKRCNVTEGTEITWFDYCSEPGSKHKNNLGYCWQAEFRSYHIWTHPAIMKYKYMIWMDADARVGTHWNGDNDPMKMMVENDLNLLFSGFPYGKTTNVVIKEKMEKAYNKSICAIYKNSDGNLNPHMCTEKSSFLMKQVAGNHHISNLETYRKPVHQQFLKDFVGDYRFARQFDDQIAITIPAVMEGRKKAWHERSHGLVLKIGHHRMFDNVASDRSATNWRQHYKNVKDDFTGIEERCGKYVYF